MKKNLFFLAMPLCLLALSLVLVGCEEESKDPPQTNLIITGIPSEYTGMIGFAGLSQGSTTRAWSMPQTISGSSVTNALLDYVTDESYSANGNYTVIFIIASDISSIEDPVWDGYVASKSITGETIYIPFNEFTKLHSFMVLPLSDTLTENVLPEIIQKLKELNE